MTEILKEQFPSLAISTNTLRYFKALLVWQRWIRSLHSCRILSFSFFFFLLISQLFQESFSWPWQTFHCKGIYNKSTPWATQSTWHSNNMGGQTSGITFISLRVLKEAFQIHHIITSYLFYWGPIDYSTPIYSQPISFINKVELT